MTRVEYFVCARDMLAARQALKLTRDRMQDFAEAEQDKAWRALEALWVQLWEGFDAVFPDETNPFTGTFWDYP